MTTPRDLLIVAMDIPPDRMVEHGDVSLALAGAEVVDLLAAGSVRVEGERVVPVPGRIRAALGDPLLDAAAAEVRRERPHETLSDWLWRRGRGLAQVYLDTMEAAGLLARADQRRWLFVKARHLILLDSAARARARFRWAAEEPVLAGLAAAVGVLADEASSIADDAVASVISAVMEAVAELSRERVRRGQRLQAAVMVREPNPPPQAEPATQRQGARRKP